MSANGPGPPDAPGGWDRLAEQITRRPGRTLVLALVPLLLPLLALPTLQPSHDTLAALPDDAESVQGFAAIEEHFGAAGGQPVVLLFDDDDAMHTEPRLAVLADLSRAVARLPGVASVRSAAMPTGGDPPPGAAGVGAGLSTLEGEIDDLRGGLRDAVDGAEELAGGIGEVERALARARAELPELTGGLDEAADGAGDLVAGLRAARDGVAELRAGTEQLADGVAEAEDGARQLRVGVADPTAAALTEAMEAFDDAVLGPAADPSVRRAAEATGEAYALVTGRYPPGHPQEGAQVEDDYDGLSPALAELADGLRDGARGVAELDGGLAELADGLDELIAGAERLRGGLVEGAQGVDELSDGIDELHAGVADELAPGAERLAVELRQGTAQLDEEADALDDLGGAALPRAGGPPFQVTPSLLDAQPELRSELGLFTTDDGTRTRMLVTLDRPPFSTGAIETTREVERLSRAMVTDSALADADMVLTGSAAYLSEIDAAASRDFPVIVGAVVVGVATVVAVLLRSLVIPVYMVASVMLTYGASLGTTTWVFQHLLGAPGIHWWIPSMLFVLLVVLGVDYSIFLMSRVREEARGLASRDAVAEGVRRTGGVITACGVILAGTFAVLLTAPLRSLVMLGFAAAVGILLDTFVVRALVVPSLATLLGRHNWWPARRARSA